MKKYRCPKCKTEFVGKLEHCPNCNIELHYMDEEIRREVKAPVQAFHYDDFDVNSEGIEEEIIEQEEENSPKRKAHYADRPDDDARVDAFGNYLSYFDGGATKKFFLRLGCFLLTICTLFIGLPWAMCAYYRWETSHTVIDGRRLAFDGKGKQLFGRYLLWLLLTILTIFIFVGQLSARLKKWKMMHTHFASLTNN